MRIYIAIFTYNRLNLVKKMSRSFFQLGGLEDVSVNVFDDSSTDYGEKEIRLCFNNLDNVYTNKTNIGANANAYKAMQIFVESGYDYFVIFDSDLLFNNKCIEHIKDNVCVVGRFMGLYNSCLHKNLGYKQIEGVKYVVKKDVGAAGSVFKKDLIKDILLNVPLSRSFDWDWSKYLRESGVDLTVVENSLVQHIGFDGQNCSYYSPYEIGLGFKPEDEITLAIYLKTIEEMIIKDNTHKNFCHNLFDSGVYLKNGLSYRIAKYLRKY